MTEPLDANSAKSGRRVGPSRLSTWTGRRIRLLWLLWPATIIAACLIAVLVSLRVYGDFSEVRVDLTRSNLVGVVMVILVPPACLTALWWRMRGRRHASSSSERR